MKQLLIAVLLACCQAVAAQSIDQIVDQKVKVAEARQKAYADSLFKVKGDGGGTQNPPSDLKPCDRGPVPGSIVNVTTNSAVVIWDGENVFGWDYSIYKGTERVAFNSVKPVSNRESITFAGLSPGEYTFTMQANTCKSEAKSIKFTVPKQTSDGGDNGGTSPPPVPSGKFVHQIIMQTTGSGFQSDAKYGLDNQWIERIEATKLTDGSGVYGIYGICAWIPWDGYEKKKGVYEEAALRRLVKYCRDRDLTLSVAFMRRRHRGESYDIMDASGKVVVSKDYFIRDNEIITGSNGTQYIEGVPSNGNIYAGYANDRVNELSAGAIKSIARIMAEYDKSFYIGLVGGGAGEQVNYVFNGKEYREAGDLSEDNLHRFDNNWLAPRGVPMRGIRPPMVQGAWNDWPYPNYNDTLGVEFGRFTTYGQKRAFDSFVDAVKSENAKLICTYQYSVADNLQFRSIQNPNINWIAEKADGLYGSDGDGIGDQQGKDRVNSLNLGTFPTKISMAEEDPDDISFYKAETGKMPPLDNGGLQYQIFENTTRRLFSRGLMVMNLAMAWGVNELRAMEPTFRSLRRDYVGHEYKWPNVNSSNTKTVNVTAKYRNSFNLMEGIDPTKYYVKYTDEGFWGGVSPEVGDGGGNPDPQPSKDYSPVKSYVEANLANAYNWNAVFDLRSPSGELYSFEKGGKTKETRFKVMSHSKFVTGVIISYVIEKGKLSLDTKVGDVIPSWKNAEGSGITLSQIMGHLSGIPDDQSHEGMDRLDQYVDWLANVPLKFTPGATFSYSSVSYQVAARMAEIVTRKAWKDLFREILADPCEMGDAEFNPSEGPIPGKPLNPLAGYGLQCSVNQWMNFIGMIRDKGMYKGRRVLNEKVFDILKTPTSRGWSDWGVGVMIKDGKYVSEAASGPGTTILEGEYAWTIFTDSSYDKTYWQNIEVRKIVDQTYLRQ